MTLEPRFNPFPGLRHFESSEDYLFFGRDGQSDEVLRRLRLHHFLAVLGSSGSGKSSLIRAGLVPSLHGGLMAKAGSRWRVAIFRPGNDPIGNLSGALSRPDVLGGHGEADAALPAAGWMQTTLRQSSLGLVEAVRLARLPERENVMVIVDQFEELFRFAGGGNQPGREDDAAAFVKLLLEAANQERLPIYVVITLRSDFIGDCTRFRDLPEAVNEGLYLIPRMTRDQRREAITGPVAVGGGEIAPRLVNRLLNDAGESPDQLPALQHALMRTWDFWVANHGPDEPMDLRHYEAIGGIASALSQHADEIYEALPSDRARGIARRMFQCLSERGPDNREVRRPTKIEEIAAVAGAEASEVISVVDSFRQPGRSFLMPPADVALAPQSVIDISHESLIRGWQQLRGWVEEESTSASIYRRLAETAALHEAGKAGLWRDPDLQIALAWRAEQSPNETWAQRYHAGYSAAMNFLDASKVAHEAEAREREAHRVAELSRARRNLATVSVLLICALAAFVLSGYLGIRSRRVNAALRDTNSKLLKATQDVQAALAQVTRKNKDITSMSEQLQTKNEDLKKQTDRAEALLRLEKRQSDIARANEEAARTDEKSAVSFANDTMQQFFTFPQDVKSQPAVTASNKLLLGEATSLSEQVLKNAPNNIEAQELRVISRATKLDLELSEEQRGEFRKDYEENLKTGESLARRRDNYEYRVLAATLFAATAQSLNSVDPKDARALDAAGRAAQIADGVQPEVLSTDSSNWFFLGFTYSAVAWVQNAHGKFGEAERNYQKAVTARKNKASAMGEKVTQFDVDRVLDTTQNLADLQNSKLGDEGVPRARVTYSEAVSYAGSRMAASTKDADKSYFMGRLFWQLLHRGDAEAAWKEFRKADDDFKSAAKLLNESLYDSDNKRFDSYAVHIRQGSLRYAEASELESSEKNEQRLALLREALHYHQEALQSASHSPAGNRDLSEHENCYFDIGRDYLALGEKEAARRNYEEAVKTLDAAASNPSDNDLRRIATANHELHLLSEQILDYAATSKEIGREIKALQRLIARSDSLPSDKLDLASAYGNRSWVDLFLGDFDTAVSDSQAGLKFDPSQTWILTNEAHGYLFSGNAIKAREVYLCQQDTPVLNGESFRDAVLNDFKEFRKSAAFSALPGQDEKLRAMEEMEKALRAHEPCPSSSPAAGASR